MSLKDYYPIPGIHKDTVAGNGSMNITKRSSSCDKFNCLWACPIQAFRA